MLIAGAGGFARELLEILLQQDRNEDIAFYDDVNPSLTNIHNEYAVLKNEEEVKSFFHNNNSFCIGVGGVAERRKLFETFVSFGGRPVSILSAHARVGRNEIVIGEGCIVATGSIITTNVQIGRGSLINFNCTITHDVRIGEFCELAPGVHISGNCRIGDNCFIGTGAVVLPGITVGENVVIGAGAVVTENTLSSITVVGVPARPIKR